MWGWDVCNLCITLLLERIRVVGCEWTYLRMKLILWMINRKTKGKNNFSVTLCEQLDHILLEVYLLIFFQLY